MEWEDLKYEGIFMYSSTTAEFRNTHVTGMSYLPQIDLKYRKAIKSNRKIK
jgi:hypothetical protein